MAGGPLKWVSALDPDIPIGASGVRGQAWQGITVHHQAASLPVFSRIDSLVTLSTRLLTSQSHLLWSPTSFTLSWLRSSGVIWDASYISILFIRECISTSPAALVFDPPAQIHQSPSTREQEAGLVLRLYLCVKPSASRPSVPSRFTHTQLSPSPKSSWWAAKYRLL